ncbi:MAG: hypothetical protein WA431_01355 [Candidatus Cybelea sp.]
MSEDSGAANPDLEATAREWLRCFQTRDIDEWKLTEGFPRSEELGSVMLRLLGEPTSLKFIESGTDDRDITTHRFRVTFQPEMEYWLGFTKDGKLNLFSIKPRPEDSRWMREGKR